MKPQIAEALGILQEECAEVIVEVSKIRRFGLDTADYNANMERTHRASLTNEVGDVLAMIGVLIEQKILDPDALELAHNRKIEKLKVWSKIFTDPDKKDN